MLPSGDMVPMPGLFMSVRVERRRPAAGAPGPCATLAAWRAEPAAWGRCCGCNFCSTTAAALAAATADVPSSVGWCDGSGANSDVRTPFCASTAATWTKLGAAGIVSAPQGWAVGGAMHASVLALWALLHVVLSACMVAPLPCPVVLPGCPAACSGNETIVGTGPENCCHVLCSRELHSVGAMSVIFNIPAAAVLQSWPRALCGVVIVLLLRCCDGARAWAPCDGSRQESTVRQRCALQR